MKKPLFSVCIFLILYIVAMLGVINLLSLTPDDYSLKSLVIVDQWKTFQSLYHKLVPHYIENGKLYPYLSHPPLAYYTLYAFNKLSGLKGYYALNGLLIAISGFFVYLTVCLLTLKHAQKQFSIFAWIGMLLYLFSYPILRFQFLNYHPDIFILPFLIISQYLFLKLLMKERYRSLKYLLLISLFLAIMSYSSWFGAVFNLIIILIALFNLRRGYKLFPYILIAVFITITISFFIYGQYSLYGGWKNVIYYFKDTYWRESPFYGQLRQSGVQILIQTLKNLGVYILWLLGLVLYSILSKKRKFLFTKNGYRYIVLSVFPLLIYSILLIHYFQNTFVSLYFMSPLILSIIIWLEKLYKLEESRMTLLKIVSLIVLSNLSLFLLN